MSLPILALLLATQTGVHSGSNNFEAIRQRVLGRIPRTPMNEIMGGKIMVKLRPSVAQGLAEQKAGTLRAVQSIGLPNAASLIPTGTFRSQIGSSGWTLWQIPEGADVWSVVRSLRANPEVLAAEPLNRIYPLIPDPNDPDWYYWEDDPDLIFSLFDEVEPFRRAWNLVDTNALAGWSVWPNRYYSAANKPHDAPLIAIIDTGCDMDHPDFINATGRSSDVSDGGQLDKSLSTRFELGEQVVGASSEDENGHGTHVTGIALAAGNNGRFSASVENGILGTGYPCKGMVLRVFDDAGIGTDADAAAAIYYAADHGAAVINLSLGTTNFSQLFQDAVTYAFQKGSLVVAAGNESGNGGGDLGPIYPAACSGALAVTANGESGQPATGTYAGTGPYIDIAAPGGDVFVDQDPLNPNYKIQYVWSTSSRDPNAALAVYTQSLGIPPYYTPNYAYLAGTSMATPAVSGAAGLYFGKNGLNQTSGWANLRTYRAIEMSAATVMGAPRGSWEYTQGYGCLDIESMLLDFNARGATVGAIEGIVYYNGTALGNVTIRAQKVGSQIKYQTSTRADGGYRFEVLPPGVYTVTAVAFGAAKVKSATVKAGSDQTAVDFWCGPYTGDETAPTLARFDLSSLTSTGFSLRHWAYDTETGIDRMSVRIGKKAGATDVLADTEMFPENPVVSMSGLSIPRNSAFQARYVNGANLTTSYTTMGVTEDAYVRDGASAGTNFGYVSADQTKKGDAGMNRVSYVKIDTTGIPGSITHATLRFAAARWSGATSSCPIELAATPSNWTEGGLTWNNAPAALSPKFVTVSVNGPVDTPTWYEVDITNFLNQQRAAGRSVTSIMFRVARSGEGAQIYTRESASLAPQVVINAAG